MPWETISVSQETKELLREAKREDETWSELLDRLMDELEK